jgi:hypothetical protein
MDIIRQVRFSMRSELGSVFLVLEYSFQIWVPRGSFRCSSSGVSASGSRHVADSKTLSRSARRADDSVGESSVLALVREWTAEDVVEDEGAVISPMLRAKGRGDVMSGWPPRSWLNARLPLMHRLSCRDRTASPSCLFAACTELDGRWLLARLQAKVQVYR